MRTTDKKILAVVAVVIIVIAAVGVYLVVGGGDDDEEGGSSAVGVIARVNTDGSGIYLKEGLDANDYVTIVTGAEPTDEEYYLGGDGTWVVFHKEAWDGAVFGDPGEATIQHVQLGEIASLMGLNFQRYIHSSSNPQPGDGNLYYITGVNTYETFLTTLTTDPIMVGAFQWEAQYSVAVVNGCEPVVTTNDMFPGHTCCIIGGDTEYMQSHQDETVRFLAAYIESVKAMQEAIANHVTGELDELMEIAIDNVTMPLGMTEVEKIEAIESAFGIVNYTYADSDTASDPLGQLKDDMAELADQFYDTNQVSSTVTDLGFGSAEEYAELLVQSQYMAEALSYERQDSYSTVNITVAVLNGDIHQLAIHYGMATGIFADYGINITLSGQEGGPQAFTALINGGAQFALLGAPPMTINAINGGYITG